ncbi:MULTISPECIES: hypothetical protein [unclassified Polaromonas]|uniref:hypothetical protein n=1 Tax=unclassified Polaromonas TaxID=2638319 RepID=UPI0018CB7E95|nr:MULTISPECIES: hypothetical protein [unclassified Polaromonas]MBG6072386.1 hypothetical protein [Polaromonas sp. CG_9.7]MBG6114390.1 hypothetical protein [Polaromonas sp. CG_9.2]MDH6185344.1 hypothetical protein [Polaromonas sp. CG_23.6]
MCRAPFSIVFSAVLLGAAFHVSAHESTAVGLAQSTVGSHNGLPISERLDIDKVRKSNAVLTYKENPIQSQIALSTSGDVDRLISKPAFNTASIQPYQVDSEWRFIAALLGTMAIIGTIAVRRRKPSEPWP